MDLDYDWDSDEIQVRVPDVSSNSQFRKDVPVFNPLAFLFAKAAVADKKVHVAAPPKDCSDVIFYAFSNQKAWEMDRKVSEYEKNQSQRLTVIGVLIDGKEYRTYAPELLAPYCPQHHKYSGWLTELCALFDAAKTIRSFQADSFYGILVHMLQSERAEQRLMYWRYKTIDLHTLIRKHAKQFIISLQDIVKANKLEIPFPSVSSAVDNFNNARFQYLFPEQFEFVNILRELFELVKQNKGKINYFYYEQKGRKKGVKPLPETRQVTLPQF